VPEQRGDNDVIGPVIHPNTILSKCVIVNLYY